jgi:hypothetical protein
MGLDAVVYKNRSKFPLDPERAGLEIEQKTGEWYSQDGQLPPGVAAAGVETLHQRLGNVALIAWLREQVARLLPADSVLLGLILRDGAHSGDVILPDRAAVLRREISMLRSCGSPLSPELTVFLYSLEALVEAAKHNRNPIVFV